MVVLQSIRTHLMRSQPAVAHPVTKTNMKLSTQSFSAATTVATTFIDSLSTVASTVNKIRFTTPLEGLRELDSPDDGEDTDDEDSDNEEDPNMSLVDEDDCICESEEMAMTSSRYVVFSAIVRRCKTGTSSVLKGFVPGVIMV